MTPKVTIDACIPQELWKTQDRASVVTSLLDLARDASVDLAITTRVDQDIPNMPLSARIRELPEIGVQRIGAPFRLNLSKLGGDDVLASTGFGEVRDSIEAELERRGLSKQNRPDWRDWDHLEGHYLANRDVFLTWDGDILGIASQLKARLG
ncbi:MAG: hypothetical protein OXG11_06045, partial [Chloroflexi bacterium]|nr:hypothetical protein [Chloroflexota bacterium]